LKGNSDKLATETAKAQTDMKLK